MVRVRVTRDPITMEERYYMYILGRRRVLMVAIVDVSSLLFDRSLRLCLSSRSYHS